MWKELLSKAHSLVKRGSTEIVTSKGIRPASLQVTEKMIDDYLFGTSTKLIPEQKVMFKQTAMMMNLNPFLKEIHAIPYEEKYYDGEAGKMISYEPKRYKLSIVTGYPAYLKRGERQKDIEYWGMTESGKINFEKPGSSDYRVLITIKRKSWSKEFIYGVDFIEVAPRDKFKKIVLRAMWKTQPKFQARKCAFAQAFRICFPEEMGSLPCIPEEIESDIIDVTPVTPEKPAKKPEKKKKEEKKKYKLPDNMFPDTICNLGKYQKEGIEYGQLPINQLLLLRDMSENPEALDGVLNNVISANIRTAAASINYTVEEITTIIRTVAEKENLMDLNWEEKLKVYRQIQNIAKKQVKK